MRPMIDYAAARLNMVDGQLRTNGVVDRALLEAFLAVPRERFVPEALKGVAYTDKDLPLGNGRYLMEPLVLARLTQLAELGPNARVLCVGSGPGYDAAVIAHFASAVVALESDSSLAATARHLLVELGYVEGKNIEFVWRFGDGRFERLPQLARELVEHGVDIIIPATPPAIRAVGASKTRIR